MGRTDSVTVPGTGHVAIVIASFGSGGAERVLLNIAAGLCDLKVRVRLLVLDPAGPLRAELDDRVEVVELARRRARTAGPRILRELRSHPPDVVLASQTHLNLLLGLLRPAFPSGCRLVIREPLLDPTSSERRWWTRITASLLARADVIIASSALMQQRLVRLVGATPVVRLPNPVDVDRLRRDATPSRREEPADPLPPERLGRHRVEAVVIARLVPQKGHEDLLRALAEADRQDLHVTFIGDGPLRDALETLRDALDLHDRVTFAGRIDDRQELAVRLSRADLLIQPAHYEGMPNTVLEALALGTPVLATDELQMLRELAAGTPRDAIRLVPRDALAAALRGVPLRPGPRPRPSLLPDEHARDRVVERLHEILLGDRPSPGGGARGGPGA